MKRHIEMSLVQMLAQSIDRYASKPVILQSEKEISYAELGRMVRKNRQGQSLRSVLSRASLAVRSLVL